MNIDFDEEKYWVNRGRNYFEMFKKHKILQMIRYSKQEKEAIRILKATVFANDDVNTILEIGCGFGRITKLLLENFSNIQKIEAFDLSEDQIQNAKRYVTDTRVSFKVSNVFDYPFCDESFDLILAFEVLMHIPSKKIGYVIQKMYSSSKKYIVSLDADWYFGKLSPECFNHAYFDLYKKILRKGDTLKRFKLKDHFLAKLFKNVRIRQSLYIIKKE